MKTVDISIGSMLLSYLLLLAPIGFFLTLRIKLIKETLLSVFRMTIQLLLVGFYLQFVFQLNAWWLNLLWVIIMITVANFTVVRRANLKQRIFFFPIYPAIFLGSLAIILYFMILVIKPAPIFDARYLIPLSGMILGNCLRSNVIALERFYASLKRNRMEYFTYLTLGASKKEAILPYLKEACAAALAPTIATIATIGLVALPGMMTGVILGGASPMVAIKYQIAIMTAIFSSAAISAILAIFFSLGISFDEYGILKAIIFKN